ncbi:hypothetical protein NQZ68_039002 [Dissostichus eleginoides]|nr:hypothetical protein NQZ68_039002 [Dissostichus eleginoides]
MFASEHGDIVQGHNNGDHFAMSPKSLLQPLDQVLHSAEEKPKKRSLEKVALREEIAKLKLKQFSTSEALKELMSLQTQAKTEKEEMEAKINEMEENFNKGKASLRTELSDAQSHIHHLEEENVKLTMKDDSTSEALKELMSLQTQDKTKKEQMEAKINEMEENFNKEKTTWSDLCCQRLEEINSLRTELSDAQSHIHHLKEENAKLTMKDDSTSEALKELMSVQTQAKTEKEEMEEDFNKEKTTWSDLCCQRLEEISSLRTELSDAQSHINHLKEENVKLTMKDDSTSEALKELMSVQTQAKTEKEEMEAKINEMEEDFNKEKTTWSDLCCQRLGEITSLRTELSDAQSHIDHLKEENAKLMIKDDSTSEALKELMSLQTQAKMEKEELESKINEMEENFNKEKTTWSDLCCQRLEEITSLRTELSDAQSHNDHLKEENAKLTMKDDSTSEALKELMSLQTQAKTEKEEMEEDFNKEKTTWSDLCCQRLEEITSLRTELSDAQSHINHLKEENAKLTMKDDSTTEALKELMSLQTKAKTEKDEMEEDFNKEKTTWSDLCCQRLEEITSLRTELSDAQSHIGNLKEENVKLKMKDDSTSEGLKELMSFQTQAKTEKEEMEAKINEMEEDLNKEKTTWSDLCCQRLEEMTSLRTELSDAQSHIDHLTEENVKLTMKDDSTSEALKELMSLQTQAKTEKDEMEEDFNKEKTTWSDLCCQRLEEITSLRTELSDAQSHIDHLKEENAKLTIKDDSTSEALKELMNLQTQAKTEKEEMEAKINEMEENFNKEKTTWSDLCCQRLEEITSLRSELSDAQSHINHLNEENAKLTMKDESTSEALKELMGLQTQAKTEKEEMEVDFNKEKTTWSDLCCQRLEEITSLRTELSDAQSHIDHLKEENAKLTIKDDRTSEALKELMSIQTQAKTEKDEMEAKMNEMEEDFNKGKASLRTDLSDAQSHINHLNEENAKLTMKDDSTSEALKELMSLQTQAKMQKDEMEEDFNKEKTTWSDLCCQRLEEITSLRTELSDAQSHIDHLKEENAKQTMKDDSTSKALKELMSLQTQAKMEKDEMEEDFNKEKTTWSDLCCQRLEEITSLRTELSDAQSHIDHLKEENAKQKMKDDSTSEALKELMSLQTQAKMLKEELEAKINEMEEDLNKEKTTWSDLCCQRLEEMTSLRTELSDAQSHIDHLKEENAKQTMKDDSTSEALKELMSIQTQAKTEKEEMEAKMNEMEEDFNKGKASLRTDLSDAQSHINHLNEENAKLTMKDDSTSEALKELMSIQTQAKTQKDEMEEDFNKEKTTWSDLCCQRLEEITSLRTELSDAQSHINHLKEENAKQTMKDDSTSEALKELMSLQTQAKMEKEDLRTELSDAQSHIDHQKEENAKLTMKDDSTSEALNELMSLQTQAKTEKEEMEAKMNEMEEDLNKEKTTWSDLCCQRLEEISSLRTELSDVQSHIGHLKEENVKLKMKDESTSEALKELMGLQTQAKTEKEEMEVDFNKEKTTWSDLCCQRLEEITSLRTELSDAQSHIDHQKEENAKLTMKDDSTSEALKELMSIQTQAKTEKDEMEAKMNEMEEDFNKGKASLRTDLSDAQSHINHLNEENAKLTMKDDSTSEALKELMSLQTQAKTEKEEMEEDFNKLKTTWSDLCCQRLEEITSLRTELSDAQSHIDHLKEENAKQTMKDDSTSKALKELMSLQTQAKTEKDEMEEDFNKEKTTWSDLCCQRLEEITSLRTELSDAQSHIDHLKEENAKQTMKDDSTSEALKELMSLQTQAKTEKDEMEEDFNEEKITWSDLCCQRLEEITSLRTELSDAQSHINHLKEENAKLTIKDDRTSEALKELMSIQTQAKTEKEEMEAKMNEMEEDFNKGKASLRTDLSDAQSHINHLNEENAKLTMKDDSTSEALKELMSIQTQAKTQKDEMEEDFNKEKTTWSDLCCQRLQEITSLRTELSDAQSHINHLKEENAKQTMKDDSTSEALKELMSLQTQAKMEKEELEAKINEMEENFNKEKTTWSDLCCQRLEEITSLRTEMSDAQSHIDHQKEENAKLTMKDDSTSEALNELMSLQTQAKTEKEEMEAKMNEMEEDLNKEKTTWSDLCCQRLEEISSLRTELSDVQSHIGHLKEENVKLKMKGESTSEALKELMGLQTQAKTEKEEMEVDFNKEKTTWSDLCCQRLEEITSVRTELSDAQSHIDHLKEENAKLTIKDDRTSEALKELMSIQTQAKTEKDEMEAKMNEMEEDFNKGKASLRTDLSDAQSHINHLDEENAKLTMKDDSTSEALKELLSLQTQAKTEKEEMEEDFNKEKTTWSDLCCQRLEEITSLRTELSDAQSHIDHLKEENAKQTMKDDSTSKALKELMSLQTQAKTEKEEMEEDFNKEKTTWSDLCCQRLEEITSLRTELSDAQSHINHLKEENAKLTIKDDSTSEAFKELMSLQTQAKTEKEELEAKINEMEENFNKENTTWSDLCCQRLEEITSLRTELSDAQSHIDHQKEENAKLTIKDESTSEALNELMSLQTQAKTEKDEMEEDFNKEKTTWSDLCCQRLEEITSLRTELSDAQSHINHLNEENAKLTMKDDSTSEALKELMSLQTQAKTEKDEMEEDFNKEKTTWSDLCCQRLEEITSLRTELSDAQSHIDHLKEENAKLTMKDESTSEALKDLMGLQTQAKTEKEEMEEDFNKEKTTWSDLCCQRLEEITSLRTELSDAQSHIDHLKEENAKQTMKDDSTSKALKELMSLQTQAKTEKDEMEEDFNKEKTTWSDLCCQRLEEITSLRTELSDAQSHIDHLKEENAKLTIKDDRTSEALKELMSIQTQAKTEKEEMEAKMNEMEEDFNKGKASLRTDLSDAQSHINHLNEENAKLTMKDDSTSEALKELMSIQTQAKTQKDEMEEDFNKEKTTWSDLCCQRLEEITSLRTELSDAQSHINHLKEENAKQTMKDDSTSEALKELMSLQTQAKMEKEELEAKINEMEENFNKEKTTWSDLCCQRLEEITSLRTELSDAQSHIDHQKEENAKLTMKDDSTSEALNELMSLQTQAKMEKEEMEAKMNEMEEDLNKEKTTWSDLCCQRLEEISSLRTELSDAQSHIDHLKEENAKLTMKDESTSEALKDLMGLQTQAKTEKEEMEEDFNKEKTTWSDLCCQRLEEITSLRTELSDAQSHIDHLKEENAKQTMKDDSTSKALKELMSLQTQAKTEKDEMEEDFNKEKTTWSDLCCQRLEEITSLRTELSDAQSHIDHLKEENAKLTIKDDRTSEALKELMSIQTQAKTEKEEMEAKMNEMEEDFNKGRQA